MIATECELSTLYAISDPSSFASAPQQTTTERKHRTVVLETISDRRAGSGAVKTVLGRPGHELYLVCRARNARR
jgi:hypothetical protein